MSHFIFLSATKYPQDLSRALEEQGLALSRRTPSVVLEMIEDQDPGAVPALITATPDEETSDSIISPFVRTPEEIAMTLSRLQAAISQVTPTSVNSLFVTEGFDTDFAEVQASVPELAETLRSMLQADGMWPSLRLRLGLTG